MLLVTPCNSAMSAGFFCNLLRRSQVTFRCVHKCTARRSLPIGAKISAASAIIRFRTASFDLNFCAPCRTPRASPMTASPPSAFRRMSFQTTILHSIVHASNRACPAGSSRIAGDVSLGPSGVLRNVASEVNRLDAVSKLYIPGFVVCFASLLAARVCLLGSFAIYLDGLT